MEQNLGIVQRVVGINNMELIDNYKEHEFHKGNTIKNATTCSECYKEVLRRTKLVINNSNNNAFELMSERNAHPEEAYW